jgi:orotate phosphoribosyltransferase
MTISKRAMSNELFSLIAARNGHFRLESGHHGSLWLDLELLMLRPGKIRPFARELAHRLATIPVAAVCGPLVEGAFVAQMVAEELDVPFSYTGPRACSERSDLYPLDYRVPAALRETVRDKPIAIVNDVINAGSAVGATYADLVACGARPVAVAALLLLGEWSGRFAAEQRLTLESIAALPNEIWTPDACPLCAAGQPLDGIELAPR